MTLYRVDLAERRRLLAVHHDEVFGKSPGSEGGCEEVLGMVSEHLIRVHPEWFGRDENVIHNRLTGEHWNVTTHDPLELAGRLVQEDLCLIELSDAGPGPDRRRVVFSKPLAIA